MVDAFDRLPFSFDAKVYEQRQHSCDDFDGLIDMISGSGWKSGPRTIDSEFRATDAG